MRAAPKLWPFAVRCAAGAIFVIFGLAKFTSHASEVSSFRTYGLPWPGLVVYLVGVLELVGGLLLLAGVRVKLVALAVAGDMIGAIALSGIGRGETISLTLAPALLVTMIALIRAGGGRWALDARSSARRQ